MSSHATSRDEDQPYRAEVIGSTRVAPASDGAGHEPPPAPKAPSCDPVAQRIFADAAPGPDAGSGAESPAELHRRMVGAEHANPRRRRVLLPIALFLVTCASTFWAGCLPDQPELLLYFFYDPRYAKLVRAAIMANWQQGLVYMACVLAILLTHEMGHFLMTLRYRIAASLPYFIPIPITPIGTMGAVISMDGLSANRRQIFDIGLAGPLAGLVVAIPIMWYGAHHVELKGYDYHQMQYEARHEYNVPYIVHWMMAATPPEHYTETGPVHFLSTKRLNPFFMAGWVGLLITGLNMMPISQLDGGHVIYALFGKRAHAIARLFLFGTILLIVLNFERAFIWLPMVVLVTLIGTDHPPTADDDAPLGALRTMIGWASLSIPFLCFPIFAIGQLPRPS